FGRDSADDSIPCPDSWCYSFSCPKALCSAAIQNVVVPSTCRSCAYRLPVRARHAQGLHRGTSVRCCHLDSRRDRLLPAELGTQGLALLPFLGARFYIDKLR